MKAKTSLKSGKSCGEDGAAPEVLTYVPVDNIILDFINQAYDAGELLDQWNLVNNVQIPKSGGLTNTDNRGVSLSMFLPKPSTVLENELGVTRAPRKGCRPVPAGMVT